MHSLVFGGKEEGGGAEDMLNCGPVLQFGTIVLLHSAVIFSK